MRNLFRRRRAVPAAPIGSPPAGTRLYAIGDIHGRLDLLCELQAQIAADAALAGAPRNVVVYLGDYVDRGPDSKGVIDRLIDQPLAGFESVHLRGNHEQSLLDFLRLPEDGENWLSFGGIATLDSYDVAPPQFWPEADAGALAATGVAFAAALPERHLAFYRDLPLCHVEGDFALVHAGMRPGIAIDAQNPADLIWIREPFLSSEVPFGKIVVHGHTISEQPVLRPNRIGIDTGAYRTGTLTCVVVQNGELGFLRTGGA